MKQEHKLYAGLAVLVVLIGAVYMVQSDQQKEADKHTVTAAADLPEVKVAAEDKDKITKLVVKNKDKDEVTLEKKGDTWEVTKPLSAPANQANIKSLLDNLEKIEIKALIAKGTESYEKYELNDDKGVHVAAFKGADKAFDMVFGKSGSRGQMALVTGTEAVYAVKGYSNYLYARDLKNWRDTEIVKFEDKNAVNVEVENKNGKFSFSLNEETWSASFYERDEDGELAKKAKKWERFDEAKVKDLLRAYKNLKATDFAAEGADAGVDDPIKNGGGVVRVKLKDDAGDYELKIGKTQENKNRYLVKEGGDGTVYVVTSWAADWATAEPSKFEKAEEKEVGEDGEDAEDGEGAKKVDAKKVDAKKVDAKKVDAKKVDAKKK